MSAQQLNAEHIFSTAREKTDPKERAGYLDGACGNNVGVRAKVEALLAADAEAGSFLRTGIEGSRDQGIEDDLDATIPQGSDIQPSKPNETPGTLIGRYKLLQQIGEGGFGSVWMAEQREPVKRRVALKIIKLGMDTKQTLARFEAERQALAMMDHPNIAKVLDAGSTDAGRPYFVMEYVKGIGILEYCDTEKLDTPTRLDLFAKICHAIQHAHQKGIIHRDIKPSNVMITLHDGVPVPKVIDFGIAKATNAELTEKTLFTQHRQMIGTPAYMSPEQAEMSGLDIDTRSDIYSLGVLLYELLTGTTPFDSKELMSKGFAEMVRIIREDEPHKPSTRVSSLLSEPRTQVRGLHESEVQAAGPSEPRAQASGSSAKTERRSAVDIARQRRVDPQSLSRQLRGDLDWIVMKCLEKDRSRRYDTANGLAADIKRHLDDEPVVAGPPGAGYRLRKFVKRNRGQVIAAGVVAAALVLGVAGTTGGMLWALKEKTRADGEAERATLAAASEAEQRTIAQANEQRAIEEADRAVAAEAGATARAKELQQVADFQEEQLSQIDVETMGVRLRRALIDAAPEQRRGDVEKSLTGLNFTNLALGSLEANLFGRTLEAIDTQFEDQPLVRAQLLQTMATTLRQLGLLEMATGPQERALAIRRDELGDEHSSTLASISYMGVLLDAQGKLAKAEPYHREALEGYRRVLGDEHPYTLASINNMGTLYVQQGKRAEAEPHLRAALEGRRRVLGDEDPATLSSINNMGSLLQRQGKLAEAELYFREALEGNRRVHGDDHPETLTSLNNMGVLLQARGKLAEAEPYLGEALEDNRRVHGDEHANTLGSISNMGALLQARGKFAEAEPYFREAMEGRRRVLGDHHRDTLVSIGSMGVLLLDQGKLAEAEPYCREALEGFHSFHFDEHPHKLISLSIMGDLLRLQGKLAEAEPYYRQALEGGRRILGDEHQDTLTYINDMGVLLQARGKLAEAEPYYREGVETARQALGDHPLTAMLEQNHADVLRRLMRAEEAVAHARAAVERYRAHSSWNTDAAGHAEQVLLDTLVAAGRTGEAIDEFRRGIEQVRDAGPDDDAGLAGRLAQLTFVALESGDAAYLADAETAARECLAIRVKLFPDDHAQVWLRHNAASLLGGVLLARARSADKREAAVALLGEAEPLLVASAEWMLTDPRMPKPAQLGGADRTGEAGQRVINLYEAWHKAEPGKGHDAKAAAWRAKLERRPTDDADGDQP